MHVQAFFAVALAIGAIAAPLAPQAREVTTKLRCRWTVKLTMKGRHECWVLTAH